MKDQFSDYETARMMRELGFNKACWGGYLTNEDNEFISCEDYIAWENNFLNDNLLPTLLWQQIKQWLWENHKIAVQVIFANNSNNMRDYSKFIWHIYIDGYLKNDFSDKQEFNSPIEAEIEGIKQAVKYLHSKLKQ